jgi:hypothetical protein
MGYLYASSEPFEPDYDAVAALEGLVSGGAEALRAARRARSIHAALEARRTAREVVLGALDATHGAVMKALVAVAGDGDGAPAEVGGYVRSLGEHAAALAAKIAADTRAAAEREEQADRADLERLRAELRRHLAAILVKLRLPVEDDTVSMRLVGGRAEMTSRARCHGGVEIDARLAAASLPEWFAPRRVLDFVAGLHLPVDVKKGWLSPTVHSETIPVGDYVVGGFSIGPDRTEIRLRRKSGEEDALAVVLTRSGDDTSIGLGRPGAAGGEAADGQRAAEVDPSARKLLEELRDKLAATAATARMRVEEVLDVRFEGCDPVAGDRVPELLGAVASLFAPTVAAIDEKTPTDGELALKYETEAGRRQEVYVAKAKLAGALAGLEAGDLAVFASLAPFGFVPAPAV